MKAVNKLSSSCLLGVLVYINHTPSSKLFCESLCWQAKTNDQKKFSTFIQYSYKKESFEVSAHVLPYSYQVSRALCWVYGGCMLKLEINFFLYVCCMSATVFRTSNFKLPLPVLCFSSLPIIHFIALKAWTGPKTLEVITLAKHLFELRHVGVGIKVGCAMYDFIPVFASGVVWQSSYRNTLLGLPPGKGRHSWIHNNTQSLLWNKRCLDKMTCQ